jgi:CRP/FNR family cyclic AMP-dependent transcriptional regulator
MLSLTLGYVASGLVFATFWMKLPIRLRQTAIASNLAFIAYALAGHLIPILALHAILLPVNVARLVELQRLTSKIKRAVHGDLSMDWLRPLMQRRSYPAGAFLFHQGDPQGDIFLVVSGEIRLVEIDVTVGQGELIGEMAVFSPAQARTLSARCETPVELLSMSNGEFLRLSYRNPDFSIYLVRLISRRLLQNIELVKQLEAERNPPGGHDWSRGDVTIAPPAPISSAHANGAKR